MEMVRYDNHTIQKRSFFPMFETQQQYFMDCCQKIQNTNRKKNQIGELSEKTVHAILKEYFAPSPDAMEVKVGKFYADICFGNQIIEIQTANFNKLREKLEAFLPDYKVTVVYPIPHIKWLLWVDEETGELSKKHKSPKTGNPYLAFRELYKIKNFLKNPNLSIHLVLLDLEEYRLLNGWSQDKKRGSCRFDRIPVGLYSDFVLECTQDYLQFIPYELECFTSGDFAKAVHIRKEQAGLVLNILSYLDVITRTGKSGNSYLYEVPNEK